MPRLRRTLSIVSLLSVAACSSSDPPDKASTHISAQESHLWRSMTDQMGKAKAVEGQLKEASQNRMKEASGY